MRVGACLAVVQCLDEMSCFLAVARFPYETSWFVSHTRFHGMTLCVGNFLMRFPVFACIDFLLRFPYEKSSCFLLHDLLMRKSCF